MADSNYAEPMQRIRASVRRASECAAAGDLDAALAALELIKIYAEDAAKAIEASANMRRFREGRQ